MGADFITCNNKQLGIDQLFKLLLEDDGSGCPVLRVTSTITSIVEKDTELKFATDPGAADKKILAAIKFNSSGGFDAVAYFDLDLSPYTPIGSPIITYDEAAEIIAFANKTAAGLVPDEHDAVKVESRFTTGPANGEIEQVKYYVGGLAGTDIATLDFVYDSNGDFESVEKS